MMFTAASLLVGLILGGAFVAYARRRSAVFGRALIIAALLYVIFACFSSEPGLWLLIELAGVALYGSMGLLGLKGSPWWLVAGWALHPVWDLALHGAGQGAEFAPPGYALACLSFDVLVAVFIAHAIVFGRLRPRRPRPAVVPA